MEEEDGLKRKPPYLLFAVLSAIVTFFFGLYIGLFDLKSHIKIGTEMQKEVVGTTEEEIQTAVLTYKIMDEDFSSEEVMVLTERLKERLYFWDEKGTVKQLSDGSIEVRMQRDYAGEANIQTLTEEEQLLFCVKCNQIPKSEELTSDNYFESSDTYYKIILDADNINGIRAVSTINPVTEEEYAVFETELSNQERKMLKDACKDEQAEELLLIYNGELLGTEQLKDIIQTKKVQVQSSINMNRANVIIRRINIGNLPLKLELISNKQ